jgi:hypothetical protein
MNETRRCLYCQSSFLPSRHLSLARIISAFEMNKIQRSRVTCSIKAAATPSGWLYKPETLSEISVTTEQFCSARI